MILTSLIARLALVFAIAAGAGFLVPIEAFPRERGRLKVTLPEIVIEPLADPRAARRAGEFRAHPGVVERPAGFAWHRGAMVEGGQ